MSRGTARLRFQSPGLLQSYACTALAGLSLIAYGDAGDGDDHVRVLIAHSFQGDSAVGKQPSDFHLHLDIAIGEDSGHLDRVHAAEVRRGDAELHVQLHAFIAIGNQMANAGQRVELDGVAAGTDARLGWLLTVLVSSKAALDEQDLRRMERPRTGACCCIVAAMPSLAVLWPELPPTCDQQWMRPVSRRADTGSAQESSPLDQPWRLQPSSLQASGASFCRSLGRRRPAGPHICLF
eukprot:scaffold11520_cov175-Isochrysis_galbana.AAC.4